jgi:hypothetical protein
MLKAVKIVFNMKVSSANFDWLQFNTTIMKLQNVLLALIISCSLLNSSPSISQDFPVPIPAPVTGLEIMNVKDSEKDLNFNNERRTHFEQMEVGDAIVEYSTLPLYNFYDYQSNGVPMQICQDPITPDNVHVSVMYSTNPDLSTKTCAYIFSNDRGTTWNFIGDVPGVGNSGFPAVSLNPNGAFVIANQIYTSWVPVRTSIHYDQGAGFGVFTALDPPRANPLPELWPRVQTTYSGRMVFGTSIGMSPSDIPRAFTNVVLSQNPPGNFSGYSPYVGNSAEGYAFALAPNGSIGHAYIGYDFDDPYDVFYRSSTDDGLTWNTTTKIWDWDEETNQLGCLRGVSLVFGNNNQPFVAFNTSKLTRSEFFPRLSSQIRVWCPGLNSGVPMLVADSTKVPFYPNTGNVSDAFLPLCRPTIGRASFHSNIFVAFNATTAQTGADTSRYYSVWFSWFTGYSWFPPERITPALPLRDWRFPSMSPVSNTSGLTTKVQMVCQSDSLAGTHVTGSPIGRGEFVSVRYNFSIISGSSSETIRAKNPYLHQNHPNPFNPETSISFDIYNDSRVRLVIYDMLGREVMRLVNDEFKTAGSYSYDFNATDLSSGIYFYRLVVNGANPLETGEVSATRKMIVVR